MRLTIKLPDLAVLPYPFGPSPFRAAPHRTTQCGAPYQFVSYCFRRFPVRGFKLLEGGMPKKKKAAKSTTLWKARSLNLLDKNAKNESHTLQAPALRAERLPRRTPPSPALSPIVSDESRCPRPAGTASWYSKPAGEAKSKRLKNANRTRCTWEKKETKIALKERN